MKWTSWLVCCVLVCGAANARAEDVMSRKAAAEALFDQGLSLMREARYREACLRLEQSQALEHGLGTMLYLADCYEQLGRSASAWALFREAASEARAAGQQERANQANERAAAVATHLAKLVIETAPGAAMDGLTLSIDDVRQPDAMWGVPVPVDPGDHEVKVTAAGYQPWSTSVNVPAASTRSVTLPRLVAAPVTVAPAAAPALALGERPAQVDRPARSKLTKWLAFGLGGVGVASVAAGIGLGVHAIHRNDDAKAYCPGGKSACTDQRGVDLTNEGLTSARASTGLIIGGAALAVAGLAVYFYHPWDRAQLALHVDSQRAALTLGGAF